MMNTSNRENMTETLFVYINGEKALDYEKNTRQPGVQRRFLDSMDHDMDEGIEINGELIESPDKIQRANYVAINLIYGIKQNSEGMISATCGYLTNRLPDLKQIRAVEHGKEVTMELLFNNVN